MSYYKFTLNRKLFNEPITLEQKSRICLTFDIFFAFFVSSQWNVSAVSTLSFQFYKASSHPVLFFPQIENSPNQGNIRAFLALLSPLKRSTRIEIFLFIQVVDVAYSLISLVNICIFFYFLFFVYKKKYNFARNFKNGVHI